MPFDYFENISKSNTTALKPNGKNSKWKTSSTALTYGIREIREGIYTVVKTEGQASPAFTCEFSIYRLYQPLTKQIIPLFQFEQPSAFHSPPKNDLLNVHSQRPTNQTQ